MKVPLNTNQSINQFLNKIKPPKLVAAVADIQRNSRITYI